VLALQVNEAFFYFKNISLVSCYFRNSKSMFRIEIAIKSLLRDINDGSSVNLFLFFDWWRLLYFKRRDRILPAFFKQKI